MTKLQGQMSAGRIGGFGVKNGILSEDADYFFLSWTKPPSSEDLGVGGCNSARFQSREGRTYFMQAEAEREAHARTALQLQQARAELQRIAARRAKRRGAVKPAVLKEAAAAMHRDMRVAEHQGLCR
jgi:nucleoid-associated protein YgaU